MTVADQCAVQKLLTATLGAIKGFDEKSALLQARSQAGQPAGSPPPRPLSLAQECRTRKLKTPSPRSLPVDDEDP